jgi:hypothetical protein
MATTAGGTTYVTGTDLVASYPTASLALANRVDVVASGGPVLVKTAGYTITVADILSGNKFLYNSASPGTFTLPTSSLVDGMVINVAQIGAGALTVSGGTIVGTTVTTAQYQSLQFVYVASGTTWYSVAPPSAAPGLSIVSPSTVQTSGGSASASGGEVTFTGVTSVSLNGVFSSTYDNYLIKLVLTNATAAGQVTGRMRAAGSDNTGASSYIRQAFTGYASSSAIATQTAAQWTIIPTSTSAFGLCTIEMGSPFLAANTMATTRNIGFEGGPEVYQSMADGLRHIPANSYDGLTFTHNAGAITGKIRVYGYKNS